MLYEEIKGDLFAMDENYFLAHCISADFGMGKGIVVEFNKRFDMKRKLMTKYPDYLVNWNKEPKIGDCILEDRVLNLITKTNYWNKPTYESLKAALLCCKEICKENNITKLAMPVIGCGLDRLQWDKVSIIIKEVFDDMDIEIKVCKV